MAVAFRGGAGVEQATGDRPERVPGACGGPAQQRLELANSCQTPHSRRFAGNAGSVLLGRCGLEPGEGEVRRRSDQPAGRFRGARGGPPVPAVARRRGAAGRAHPLDQLDRCRRAGRKRRAAARIELPRSTARTILSRRSIEIGAGIGVPRCSQPLLSNHMHGFHAVRIYSIREVAQLCHSAKIDSK
jgi:hypothetical protein